MHLFAHRRLQRVGEGVSSAPRDEITFSPSVSTSIGPQWAAVKMVLVADEVGKAGSWVSECRCCDGLLVNRSMLLTKEIPYGEFSPYSDVIINRHACGGKE